LAHPTVHQYGGTVRTSSVVVTPSAGAFPRPRHALARRRSPHGWEDLVQTARDDEVLAYVGPAEFLIQQGAGYSADGLESSLDRFEVLFKRLNALL